MEDSLSIVFGSIFYALILPFILPPLLVLFIWRKLVGFRGSHFFNVTPILEQYLFESKQVTAPKTQIEPNVGLLTVVALSLDKTLDIKEFRAQFKNKVMPYVKPNIFQQRFLLFGGFICKGQSSSYTNLKVHIRQTKLKDKTLNLCNNFNQILNVLATDRTVLNKIECPWEILIYNEVESENGCLVVIKIHHALADGVSILRIVQLLQGTRNFEKTNLTFFVESSRWAKAKAFLKAPSVILTSQLGWKTNLKIHPFGMLTSVVKTSFLLSTVTLDFRKILEIRKRTGSRILPILICLQVEALIRGLQNAHARLVVGHALKFYKVVPILPTHYNHNSDMIGNFWCPGSCFVPLKGNNGTNILLHRLQEATKSFQWSDDHDVGLINATIQDLTCLLPHSWLTYLHDPNLPHTAVVSSLRINEDQMSKSILDSKIMKIFFFADTNSNCEMKGIGFTTTTRGTEIDIVTRVSTDLFNNQEDIDKFARVFLPQVLEEYVQLTK